MVIADFNGDGKMDLAVSNAGVNNDPGHTVSVLLGNGDGTFQPKTDFEVGFQPFDLTAAESARLLFYRRGFAVYWLYLVHKRPGLVAGQQAEHLLGLLG